MVPADASEMTAIDAESSLEDAGILKQVLSYAGAGEFIFYAPIRKLWLECYRAVPDYQLNGKDTTKRKHDLAVVANMTLRRAVYASAARVTQAHELGLRFDADGTGLQFYTGKVAAVAPLTEAHRLGMRLSPTMLEGAALSGKLSTVIWLHTKRNIVLRSGIYACTAAEGHVEVLRWLKQQGAELDERAMLAAAVGGQQETCAYLLSEGCSWHVNAVFAAALREHWDTVRWLHEHGCPWTFEEICCTAAEQGSIEAMTYILQHDVVSRHVLSEMLNVAGAYDQLAAAQCLRHQRGAEWPDVLQWIESWSGDVLAWARAEGCDSPLN
jgi:hypothetical protein